MTAKEAKQLSDLSSSGIVRLLLTIEEAAKEGRTHFYTLAASNDTIKNFLEEGGYSYEENKGNIVFIDWSNPKK